MTTSHEDWRIRYDCPLRAVPAQALAELLLKLRMVAGELASIQSGSTLWSHLRDSQLHLEAGGWRFAYAVPARGLVAVVGAHSIEPPIASAQISNKPTPAPSAKRTKDSNVHS